MLIWIFCWLGHGTHATALETVSADMSGQVHETRMVLRDLWVEHVFWVRNYVFATHHKDEYGERAAVDEVVANARSIANSLEPFYGQAAAEKLFELLAGHWTAVKGYNDATFIESSEQKRQSAVVALTENAREISKFLSGANPHLPEADLFGLLSAHGGHHVAQIKQIKGDDLAAEAKTWHAMRQHMLVISDALAVALAKQFPDSF